MVEKFKQPLNKRVIFNKPPNYDNEIHKSLAIMGTLYCPGRKMQPPVEAGARKALASWAPQQCCPLVLCWICAPSRAIPHTRSASTSRMACCWLISLPLGRSTQRLLFNWDYAFWNSSRYFNGLLDIGREPYVLSVSAIQQWTIFSEPVRDREFRLLYVHLLLFECSISLQVILSNKGKGLFYYFNCKHQKLALIFSPST